MLPRVVQFAWLLNLGFVSVAFVAAVQAQPDPSVEVSSRAAPGSASTETTRKPPSHRCFVRDAMVFYDRTHVRCYNRAKGKINFFAVDTSQPIAETVLTKAWQSMRTGKPLTITYAPVSDLNPSNCEKSNCRRLLDIAN